MPHIVRSVASWRDCRRIFLWIAREDPAAAERVLLEFDRQLELLARHSALGTLRPDVHPGLRMLPVGRYLVFYVGIENGIALVRILHSVRDIRRIFRG
jgi:toxin ParE1/3/4